MIFWISHVLVLKMCETYLKDIISGLFLILVKENNSNQSQIFHQLIFLLLYIWKKEFLLICSSYFIKLYLYNIYYLLLQLHILLIWKLFVLLSIIINFIIQYYNLYQYTINQLNTTQLQVVLQNHLNILLNKVIDAITII